MIQIADKTLKIHETPLASVQIRESTVSVELDDINEKRYTIRFFPYQSVMMTTIDCTYDKNIEYPKECFSEGRYERYILEDTDSALIRKLQNALADPDDDFTKKSRHFILDLGDNWLEVVAWQMEIR